MVDDDHPLDTTCLVDMRALVEQMAVGRQGQIDGDIDRYVIDRVGVDVVLVFAGNCVKCQYQCY